MNPSPQVSAAAASGAYENYKQNDVDFTKLELHSQKYQIFGYKNDPVTGFHATAYQNLATGEIIIAYRGTDPDFKKHPGTMLQDIAVDATMVRDTINPQKDEASAFTQEMIDKAASHGIPRDQITVAGHSLGGTLAEIEAAKFGLRGITLNAYGAEGMIDGPIAAGCQLTNYRMAGDPVSGANGHIGTVVSLASPEDVASLQAGRYLDASPGSEPPNPLIAMRGGDHSGAHFTGADGNINVLNPAVMAEYAQRYKDHQAAFDHLSGDLNRERGELSVALRQMESGQPSVHLPPDVQRQVNEYLAITADPSIREAIEHNAKVQGAEQRLQDGANGARAGGQYVQTQGERAAAAARTVGDVMLPVTPFAPLAGAILGEVAHLEGQAAHAFGDNAASKLESLKQTVEQSAHNLSQSAQAAIHNPDVQAKAVGVVNRIVDTYGRVVATEHAVEQSYNSAKQAVSHGIDATESAASQAYATLTHPHEWFGHRSESSPTTSSVAAHEAAKPSEPKAYTGDHHVDALIAALDDPAAFKQAMTNLTNSPEGEAFQAQGRAMHAEMQNQQLQQQLNQQQTQAQPQVQQGPVMSR